MRFLIDEDLPRALLLSLQAAGIEAVRVVDEGLRGRPDDEIFAAAIARGLILLTGDLGFGNRSRLTRLPHPGIVIARFPNDTPPKVIARLITTALVELTDDEVSGGLTIIEPGRVRLRRRH